MKNLLKKVRENKKGFTLAELLVVVAIIAILVAISIPVFTSQLNKARIATNQANLRAAKAAAVAEYLTDETRTTTTPVTYEYNLTDGTVKDGTAGGTTVTIENPGTAIFKHIWVTIGEQGENANKKMQVTLNASTTE